MFMMTLLHFAVARLKRSLSVHAATSSASSVVGERCFFILVESHFIHGVRPLAKALNSTLAI